MLDEVSILIVAQTLQSSSNHWRTVSPFSLLEGFLFDLERSSERRPTFCRLLLSATFSIDTSFCGLLDSLLRSVTHISYYSLHSAHIQRYCSIDS